MRLTTMAVGTFAVFLGASMMVSAYHITDPAPPGPTPPFLATHSTAMHWDNTGISIPGVVEIGPGQLITTCESMGPGADGIPGTGDAGEDKINSNPTPNPGIGGLCYAATNHYGDNKALWKAKKPNQTATTADWGLIEPKCNQPASEPGKCAPRKNATGVGENWFARIGSNARSCLGAWHQTFVYKEIIAYYGGTAINPSDQGGGSSGHVTFFVNDPNTRGTYNYEKILNAASGGIDFTKSFGDADHKTDDDDSCTGNGSGWGLMDDGLKG